MRLYLIGIAVSWNSAAEFGDLVDVCAAVHHLSIDVPEL